MNIQVAIKVHGILLIWHMIKGDISMKMKNQFWYLKSKDRALYYDLSKKKWVSKEEYTGSPYLAVFPCRSYNAAKRHLRKHDEIPIGTNFILISSYVGFDRKLVKR